MSALELAKYNSGLVILKVNVKDTLAMAENPWLSVKYDYICVTRGKNHNLTIIKKDGTSFSFSFGENGYTLISDNLETLKKNVLLFIKDKGILLDVHFDVPQVAELFYNRSFKMWQVVFLGEYNGTKQEAIVFFDFECNEEGRQNTIKALNKIYDKFSVEEFKRDSCPTGIPCWRARCTML